MLNKLSQFKPSKSFKNAIWLIGGNIIHKVIAFVIGLWTARYLGPGNYGLINYANAYITFFFSLATLGINSVIVKKFIDDPEREGTTLGTTLVLQCVASILSVGMIFGIVCIADFGEPLTILVVLLSSLGLFFQQFDTVKYWFQSKLASKYAAVATIMAYIVTSAYKVILLIFGKNVTWFALATSLDYVCVAIILYSVYRHKKGPRLRFSYHTAKELLSSSCHYILSGLMVSIYGATDKLMLKQMLNEEAVGFYGTAVSLANVWVFILVAIIDSLNPVIMSLHNTDQKAYLRKNRQLYSIVFYLSLLVSVLFTVFSELAIQILYGDAYAGAAAPLRVITWYVAFSYLGVARNVWVVCENKQRYLSGIYIGSAVVNVVLNAVMIPVLGATGAAIASLISQVCTIFVIPLFIKEMRPNVKLMLDGILLKGRK